MRNGLNTETMRVYREQLRENQMSDLKPGTMVLDRSQRTGYKTVYTIRKLEGSQALVQRSGELVNGRLANMSHYRDETYRDLANLEPWH